jgi:hypothetical protein
MQLPVPVRRGSGRSRRKSAADAPAAATAAAVGARGGGCSARAGGFFASSSEEEEQQEQEQPQQQAQQPGTTARAGGFFASSSEEEEQQEQEQPRQQAQQPHSAPQQERMLHGVTQAQLLQLSEQHSFPLAASGMDLLQLQVRVVVNSYRKPGGSTSKVKTDFYATDASGQRARNVPQVLGLLRPRMALDKDQMSALRKVLVGLAQLQAAAGEGGVAAGAEAPAGRDAEVAAARLQQQAEGEEDAYPSQVTPGGCCMSTPSLWGAVRRLWVVPARRVACVVGQLHCRWEGKMRAAGWSSPCVCRLLLLQDPNTLPDGWGAEGEPHAELAHLSQPTPLSPAAQVGRHAASHAPCCTPGSSGQPCSNAACCM